MSDAPRYRRLYAHEWHHPSFRTLNDSARIVRFYVTAGPQTTSVGCFRLSTALAVEDLGGVGDVFEERLGQVCEAYDWAWDGLARVIWIRDWFEMNPPASPNVVNSWAKLLKNVPDCDVRTEAFWSIDKSLKNLPQTFREPWKELSRSFSKPEVRSEVEPETNQGSGIRDQRSGIRGAGAHPRDEKDSSDGRLLAIARRTLQFTSPNRPIEELLDAFGAVALGQGLAYTRASAMQVLNVALSEVRTQ